MRTKKLYDFQHANLGANWGYVGAKDALGREIKVGHLLMRPPSSNYPPDLLMVRAIKNNRVYVEGNPQPLQYGGRCLIMNEPFPQVTRTQLKYNHPDYVYRFR